MKETNKNIYTYIKSILFICVALCLMVKPITANAIPVQTGGLPFSDHQGMKATVRGQYVYCVRRGYPFRSRVSELQMIRTTTTSFGDEYTGTIADNIRYLMLQNWGNNNALWFRGWGTWTLNGDRTDAYQTSTVGAPTSAAWQEPYEEHTTDDEDDPYNNRYQGSGTVRRWFTEVSPYLTGHEGCVAPYATTLKEISYTEVGFNMSQVYAQAITQYYCWNDPDVSGYSITTKLQVKQALDWATQYNFITTIGDKGDSLKLIYKDSKGGYGRGAAATYEGNCDGYIKTTIGNIYEAMKLYRQVVWKTTNMRAIPSFASRIDKIGSAEAIKLYWDEEQRLYTATVSDQNGVLNYFDFSISGCTVTNNGDGTLTISTPNQIGTITSTESKSKIEPADGVFKLPDYFRWDKEGQSVTFTYTGFIGDYNYNEQGGYGYVAYEDGNGRSFKEDTIYNHGHYYSPACNWFCSINDTDTSYDCTHEINLCHEEANSCGRSSHSHSSGCYSSNSCDCVLLPWEHCTKDHGSHLTCGRSEHSHSRSCHSHSREDDKCHRCTIKCQHQYYCPYIKGRGNKKYYNGSTPYRTCIWAWCCGKQHFRTARNTVTGKYISWQPTSGVYARGQKLIDPEICYIKVETVPHEFPAETDTEILLIADNDEWNDLTYTAPNGKTIKHCSHLRVGEKFYLKYIYSYKGASKGFRIEFSLENKPYYQYNYLSRMQEPENNKSIYNLRTGLAGDRFSRSAINVPHAKLVQDLTDIKIKGVYATPETAYTLNGAYSWSSGSSWNDRVYLDALITDQFDDNYDNKPAGSISSNNGSSMLTDFTVSKPTHNDMLVVWEYDTEPEVFTSALVYGTAYIEVGDNDNYTKTYYDEAYNYSKNLMAPTQYTNWFYNFEEHNNVGGVGYFSSEYASPNGTQTNVSVPSHTIYTQNNEYRTYAIKNKVWQSDIDIKVSNFVQNTGAGITEHIYQERGRDNHDLNYNLYYTIDVENPKATIYENKQKSHDGTTENDIKTTPYDTASDINEFDINNMISWGSTGASQTLASYGNKVVVDHIKTGRTYIQREIPTVLATMTSLPKETMTFKIYPNHDRLIYEDHYTGVSISGSDIQRKVAVSAKDGYYPPNEQSAVSDIFPAMNPNMTDMQPQNINGSNNVPNEYEQDDTVLQHKNPTTSFTIKLSNGETKTIVDSHTKTYTQYDFGYNPNNRNNRVTFPARRVSPAFFKYSKTNYSYNGNNVQSGVGEFRNEGKTQTESYYISQVLFKSNYTSKYKKELEAQGADYIEEFDSYGNLTDAWIDMVNQNKFAIVSAGQGFELKVTVKYENSLLTQYLARYFGYDDGQNDLIGTSNRWHTGEQINNAEPGRQFCNISALTGKDGRGMPYYKDTIRAYVSSYSILDRLAVNLVTGANVFNDLYCFMSDNPDTVYSYSGIYDTPVVFERNIKYSDDFAVTTVTYSMCVSHENGISSNLQKMKFYTNQLAPDKKSPGIVEGTYDVADRGEHSITLWTPIITATPFDYPNTAQERYLGDAIELGYMIKTTGADDSIVHIVQ